MRHYSLWVRLYSCYPIPSHESLLPCGQYGALFLPVRRSVTTTTADHGYAPTGLPTVWLALPTCLIGLCLSSPYLPTYRVRIAHLLPRSLRAAVAIGRAFSDMATLPATPVSNCAVSFGPTATLRLARCAPSVYGCSIPMPHNYLACLAFCHTTPFTLRNRRALRHARRDCDRQTLCRLWDTPLAPHTHTLLPFAPRTHTLAPPPTPLPHHTHTRNDACLPLPWDGYRHSFSTQPPYLCRLVFILFSSG